MKFATYRDGGATRIGVVHDGDAQVFDLAAAAGRDGMTASAFQSMQSLIDADDAGIEQARQLFEKRRGEMDLSIALKSVQLLAPLPRPVQMRDGMSYPTHIRQAPRGAQAQLARLSGGEAAAKAVMAQPLGELPAIFSQMPIYYFTNRMTVVGPDEVVQWPRYSNVMDYELEVAIVTKRTAANISVAQGRNHIFGYTIFNDFSARDRQSQEMRGRLGPAKGKSFDGSNAMGPWIVTPDELGEVQALKVAVRVNGETRAEGHTGGMLFPFEAILADASQDETIHAGEVFGSGTVGNCCGLEIDRFLRSGDVIELEVEKIGVLRNKVVRQDKR